ncbi:MAG TPA: acyl-CoA desaturase [Kofleriaceae bacterium]|jgi:fatty acid desaturase|nr:acyl-CoA desaturase [Kofleriaceae bacterium]
MQVGSAKLGTLRLELAEAGLFDHRELRSWAKLGVLVGASAAGLAAIAMVGPWLALPVVPVLSVLFTAIAMFGHEGSHRSFSASPVRNAVVMYFAFPLFGGLSTLYWRDKHDRLHHGHPNVEGVDPDIKPFPFVSSRGDHEQSSPRLRWFQRNLQRWAFWPMATLMTTGMRRSSLLHVMAYPARHGRDRAWWIDVGCLALHYTAWLVVPSLVWGPLITFGLYAAVWAGVGVCLALVFAPAHMGLPVIRGQAHDWIHQLETTRDLEMPRTIGFFFIGLDYQVEHHLFPKIPHQNLPRAAAITAAWCELHGIPHQRMPYLDALGDAARFMATAWERDAADPLDVRAGLVGTSLAA